MLNAPITVSTLNVPHLTLESLRQLPLMCLHALHLTQPGMPAGLQQAMSAAMDDPAVQSMLNDPELIRTLLQANPAVREVMERNPEVRRAGQGGEESRARQRAIT